MLWFDRFQQYRFCWIMEYDVRCAPATAMTYNKGVDQLRRPSPCWMSTATSKLPA